ncbi:MAG: 3-oxo-tetronate kinase [Pseudaminobacter sp.]
MRIGVIADDFTGASDIANMLANGIPGRGGLATSQYLGVPTGPGNHGDEAGVIALKSRSIPAHDAVMQSLKALDWLRAQGCTQFVFKYCSTFDSTPAGNIGPVGEALAQVLGVRGVVACPAFPQLERTVYQGHLFVHDRLLDESGLQNHPLNPMTDPDLRRWLKQQTQTPVGWVAHTTVREGAPAIRSALTAASGRGETLVIVDALSDADLIEIGRACRDAPLVTGGSAIAIGLCRNLIEAGVVTGSVPEQAGVDGPEAILVGSCSGTTLSQIEEHAKHHPVMQLSIKDLMQNRIDQSAIVSFMQEHEGSAPLVYSSGSPEQVRSAQQRYSVEAVSNSLDRLFGQLARQLVEGGICRLVVAGGETSGAVVSALDLGPLKIGRQIDPGVPVLIAGGERRIALALKSGNFGTIGFFSKALSRMAST